MTRTSEVFFREEQRFGRGLAMLVTVSALAPVLITGAGLYSQLVLGRPFGTNPAPDSVLVVLFAGVVVLGLGLIWMFLAARLTTEVRADGLWIRFRPFHRSARRIEGIRGWEARDYRPIREYGGWGIRWGWKGGRAYNVSGTRGVDLELEDGTRLLIGSQRAEALAAALERALGRAAR